MTGVAVRTKQFPIKQLRDVLDVHFPSSPIAVRESVALRAAQMQWARSTAIVSAVSRLMHTCVRHDFTDYENLMRKHKLTRDEARLVVAKEVQEIFQSWTAHNNG